MENTPIGEGASVASPAPVTPSVAPAPLARFGAVVTEGWRQFMHNRTKHVVAAALIILGAFVIGVGLGIIEAFGGALAGDDIAAKAVLSIAFQLAFAWLSLGVVAFYLTVQRTGQFQYQRIFNAPNQLKAFVAQFVVQFIVTAGILLLVVPGILWAFRYLFVPLLVLDRGLSIKEAMVLSSRMTYGYKWRLFFYNLGLALVVLLGFLAVGIGILVAMPVVVLAWLYVYGTLLPVGETRTDVFPVGNTERIYLYGLFVGIPLFVLGTLSSANDHRDKKIEFEQRMADQDLPY